MIEIDDAGSGSLIGGTGIGLLRSETQEYIFDLIPLSLFQEPQFQEKKYQLYVIKIIQEAFHKLKVNTDEPIRVCRSYIFDELRHWLTREGYQWESTKIEGPLQEKVEESFSQYVIELGLPKNFVQHAKYAFGFHRLFKWIVADFDSRAELCKSGWKSWQKWSNTEIAITNGQAAKEVYCLKCGSLIKKGEKTKNITYNTNKKWIVELHPHCYHKPSLALPQHFSQEV